MSKPQITPVVGGYRFAWETERIEIAVSRLKTHSDGTVKGEITVTTSAPGIEPYLHGSQFNFSSDATRDRLVKKLTGSYEHLANWESVFQQLCFYVLDYERRGEPVINLQTTDEVAKPVYLLYPLLVRSLPTTLFGEPGSLKSTLALILAATLLLPWTGNPLDLSPPSHPTLVLYLDWETDQETVRYQLTRLQRGMDLGYLSLNYRRCYLPVAQDIQQIRQHIVDTAAQVVIIDSLGLACGGELNEAGTALSFFAALRQLNTTSLILAHSAKNIEKHSRHSIYGSVFFEAQARNIWEIQKLQEAGENEVDISLFHRKPPPFSKLHPPLGFKLRFDEAQDAMTVESEDPRTIDQFLERMSAQQRILAALKTGHRTPAELAEDLSLKTNTVRSALMRLKLRAQVVKVADAYGLLETRLI